MWQPIATHGTEWNPDSVQPTLNVELDACFQLSPGGGTRLDMAHLVRQPASLKRRAARSASGMPAIS